MRLIGLVVAFAVSLILGPSLLLRADETIQ
jgi:predicted RND superfamily exporter protein